MTTATSGIRVLDPDTYANGDPDTFGLPLEQYMYLCDEEPCYLHEFNDPMLIDQAWAVSRNADIWSTRRVRDRRRGRACSTLNWVDICDPPPNRP